MSGTILTGEPSPSSGTLAASRVADVLLALAARPAGTGVTEVARDLGLSKPVVHRILRSLVSRGLVAPAPSGGYALGPAAAAIGARAMRDLDLRRSALPVMRRLQAETNETATVSALVGLARVYLDQVVSHREIRMTVDLGPPFPLHAGASSKAVLAAASDDVRRAVLAAPLSRLTDRTNVDPEKLAAELEAIAAAGTAASFGERQPGAGSVAAAVIGPDGAVVGALSLCGPIDRFSADVVPGYRDLVLAAAREVSAALRHRGLEAGDEAA